MNQELLFKAQFLQKQAEEMGESLQAVDGELADLQKTDTHLEFFITNKEKSSISSIGKGLHVKTNIEGKELFVEVGAGIVVKKSADEARKIIDIQIKKLQEAKSHMMGKLEIYQKTIESVVMEIEKEQHKEHSKASGKHSHKH